MGLRGPAPKPTAIEIVEGRPGHRPINQREPQAYVLLPEEARRRCPRHLKGEERKWWRYYAPLLAGMQVVTEADCVALENLAKATAERIAAENDLRKTGPLYKTASGYVQVSPVFSIVSAMRERELKLLREFGLTPASRTRVSTARDDSRFDALEAALCG